MKYLYPIEDTKVDKFQYHHLKQDEIVKKLSMDLHHDDRSEHEMIDGYYLEEIMEAVSSMLQR